MGGNKKENLELRAYKLGFEVGFHTHDEWTSWVWKEKKKIFDEARKSKLLDRIEVAYERGKFEGFLRKKRMKGKESIIKNKSGIKVIEKPSFISKPAMTDVMKAVLLPKFLKFFK
jgi:hypothetical protein